MNSPQPTPNLARASVLSSKSNASQDPFVLNTQIKSDRRSKLHTSSVVHWLRKRHHDTANTNYLMMPNEQKQHSEVKDVFKIFDADNSGKLQMGEFYDMLKHAGITIDKEELRQFYKKVDLDNDIALDFQEFKNCTLSDEANFHFAKMMEKIRLESRGMDSKAQQEQQPRVNAPGMRRESSSKTFQPRTFGNLLNYLTYENKKQSLKDFVQDKQNDLGEKFRKFEELLDLHMGKDIYAERLSTRFEPKSMSAERTSILSRDSIMFKNSSFKPPRIDSQAMITEPDLNGNTTPSSSSSDDDNTRDAEQMELIKELDGISRKARQSAREEFFVRTNAKKRHTMVNTGSVDQQSKRSSFASRDSIMSNRPLTRNFEETTKPSKFRSQRLMTAAADDETIKCSLAIGLPSNEKLPTGSKDEVIETSDEHREKVDKQKIVRNNRNAKVTSVEKIAGWTFNPNTPKREFIIKSQTENNGKLSLPKFKGSLQIPARTLETSQGKTRIRLASPQGFTNSARDLFASPKMGSTLQKVYTPNLRLAYSGKVDFGDQSPDKDISAFSRQFTTTTGPMSTDRDRIQTEPSTADAVSAIRNTRFSFKQPSKMPKNYTIGTPESGSLSGRSHGSQRASKPNTPSSQGKDLAREKDKKVSIFAKPLQSAVGAVRE